jgi:hypothetical protein
MFRMVSKITHPRDRQGCRIHFSSTRRGIYQQGPTIQPHSQSVYLYIVLPNAHRPLPFIQDKPRVSNMTDGLIGSMTNLNPYSHPSLTYGVNHYPQPYGCMSYYPPPTHQKSYSVAPPLSLRVPPPEPLMNMVSLPSTSPPTTLIYNPNNGGSTSTSYMSYGSSPQNNPYFPFLGHPWQVALPSRQPHVGVNFVHPSPIQHVNDFEQLNMENSPHQPNNSKNKGKNRNNNTPGPGGNNPQQKLPVGGNQNQGNQNPQGGNNKKQP